MSAQITLGPKVSSERIPVGEVSASTIAAGTEFRSDYSWVASPNQEYILVFQHDGNLVLYRLIGNPPPLAPGVTFEGKSLWNSNTGGKKGDLFVVQADGNLVIYKNDARVESNAIWRSNTSGSAAVGLFVQDDGKLVLYAYSPKWVEGTAG